MKKIILTITLFVFVFIFVLSNEIFAMDKLVKNIILKDFSHQEKVNLLLGLAEHYMSKNDTAEVSIAIKKVSDELKSIKDLMFIIKSETKLAEISYKCGNKKYSENVLDKWEKEMKKSQTPSFIMAISAPLVEADFLIGRKKKAKSLFEALSKLMYQQRDDNGLAASLCMNAKLAVKLGDDTNAVKLLANSEKVIKRIVKNFKVDGENSSRLVEASYSRANLYMMMADVFIDLKRYDDVKRILAIAKLDMNKIEIYDYLDEANAMISRIYGKMKKWKIAVDSISQIGDFQLKNSSRVDLIELMLKNKKEKMALKLYKDISDKKWMNRADSLFIIYYDGVKNFKDELAFIKKIKSPYEFIKILMKLKNGPEDDKISKFINNFLKKCSGRR